MHLNPKNLGFAFLLAIPKIRAIKPPLETMKKTFNLTHPKIKYSRLIEAAKGDAKKYLKRERNKDLPEDVDFWDFDCKYGQTAESAETIHVAEINKYIDQAESHGLTSFYLEILAKPGVRAKKEPSEKKEKPAPSAWDKATKK